MTSAHQSPSSSSQGAALRGPWLLFAAAALLGCTGEITIETSGGPDRPGPGPGDETCAPDPAPAQPDPAPLAVTAVKTGVFLADTLHLEATVDGTPRYVVLRIDDQGVARAAAMPDDLLGPATLAETAPGTHARLRTSETGTPTLDIIDTKAPESPALLSSTELPGIIDAQPAFTATKAHLFYCARPSPGEPAELQDIDLTAPEKPAPPQTIESFLCYFFGESSYLAAGSTMIDWNHPTGFYVQDTYVFSLAPGSANKIVDYGYNQTGVHMYGNVLSAAMSEQRAVFDPENEALFLMANPSGNPYDPTNPPFTWTPLFAGKERHLLGVADTTLYVTTDEAIRAYDITDIVSPDLLPYEAQIEGAKGTLHTIATSPRYLAITDDEGTLFLLPRDAPSTVGPLVVHAADYVPEAGEAGCAD